MRPLIKLLPIGAAIALAITLSVSGCSRTSSGTITSQSYDQTNQGAQTVNPAAVSTQPGESVLTVQPMVLANGQPNMGQLNRVARLWMLRNQRRPTSWEDFVAHAGAPIPPPPPGKKYVLSRSMRVTLEDR